MQSNQQKSESQQGDSTFPHGQSYLEAEGTREGGFLDAFLDGGQGTAVEWESVRTWASERGLTTLMDHDMKEA